MRSEDIMTMKMSAATKRLSQVMFNCILVY